MDDIKPFWKSPWFWSIIVIIILILATTSNQNEYQALKKEYMELKTEIQNLKNSPEALYKQAMVQFRDNDFDKSEATLQSLISDYPTSAIIPEAESQLVEISKKKEELLAQQKLAEEAKKPPLEIINSWVTFNSIGDPEARVRVKNISSKTVDAFELQFYCYDNYDRPVYHYTRDDNIYNAISQHITLAPGEAKGDSWYWTLYGHDNTTKVKAVITSAHYTDGTTWGPK